MDRVANAGQLAMAWPDESERDSPSVGHPDQADGASDVGTQEQPLQIFLEVHERSVEPG
jgi:hypothetical protein